MTNSDIILIHSALVQIVAGSYKGLKFNLAISDNVMALSPLAKELNDKIKVVEEMSRDYDNERMDRAEALAVKDAQGKAKIITLPTGRFSYALTVENEQILIQYLDLLRIKYKETLDKQAEEQLRLEALLSDNASVVVTTIPLASVPDDLPTHLVHAIRPILVTKNPLS